VVHCGFPSRASRAGPAYLEILPCEMLYTGIGQFIAGEFPRGDGLVREVCNQRLRIQHMHQTPGWRIS
jgi:hypothetical protein